MTPNATNHNRGWEQSCLLAEFATMSCPTCYKRQGGVKSFDTEDKITSSVGDIWICKTTQEGFIIMHAPSSYVLVVETAANGWLDVRDNSGEATYYHRSGRFARGGTLVEWSRPHLDEMQNNPTLLKDCTPIENKGKWTGKLQDSLFTIAYSDQPAVVLDAYSVTYSNGKKRIDLDGQEEDEGGAKPKTAKKPIAVKKTKSWVEGPVKFQNGGQLDCHTGICRPILSKGGLVTAVTVVWNEFDSTEEGFAAGLFVLNGNHAKMIDHRIVHPNLKKPKSEQKFQLTPPLNAAPGQCLGLINLTGGCLKVQYMATHPTGCFFGNGHSKSSVTSWLEGNYMSLSKSKTLCIRWNLTDPSSVRMSNPDDISKELVEEVQNRMSQILTTEKGQKWLRCRLMVVGEGRAGKTTLVDSLRGRKFQAYQKSTIGVNTDVCQVDVRRLQNWKPFDSTQFGGEFSAAIIRAAMVKRAEEAKALIDNVPKGQKSKSLPTSRDIEEILARLEREGQSFTRDDHDISRMSLKKAEAVADPTVRRPNSKASKGAKKILKNGSLFGDDMEDNEIAHNNQNTTRLSSRPTSEIVPKKSGNGKGKGADHAVRTRIKTLSGAESANAARANAASAAAKAAGGEPLNRKAVRPTVRVQPKEKAIEKMQKDYIFKMLDEGSDESIVMITWDYGGQRVFYAMHHLFLTHCGVYLVVFSMVDMLNPKTQKGCLEFLRLWLGSLSVHARGAPLFIVGTHKDKITEGKQWEECSNLLRKHFRRFEAWKKVQSNRSHDSFLFFFPVDNTQSDKDVGVQNLRAQIENAAKKLDFVQAKVPITWIRVYEELKKAAEEDDVKKAFMSLSDVISVAKDFGMPANNHAEMNPQEALEQDVQKMLLYLHELGAICYHSEPGLKDFVILDPQWMVECATCVIRELSDTEIHRLEFDEEARAMFEEWDDLQKKGILDTKLLDILWKGYVEDRLDVKEKLLLLFEKYDLIVPLRPESDGPIRKYMVPSLLPIKVGHEEYMQAPRLVEKDPMWPWCLFVFGTRPMDPGTIRAEDLATQGFLPDGLFPRLVGKLAAQSQCSRKTPWNDLQCTKTSVRVSLGRLTFELTLLMGSNAIRLDIMLAYPMLVLKRVKELLDVVIDECMRGLQFAILIPVGGRPEWPIDYVDLQELSLAQESNQTAKYGDIEKELKYWLPAQKLVEKFDCYLSYRHGSERDFARVLTDAIMTFPIGEEKRKCEVFHDQLILRKNRKWDFQFMNVLVTSHTIVPVISLPVLVALNRITSYTVDTSRIYPLLLEWSLAILCELCKTQGWNLVKRICPVFICERGNESKLQAVLDGEEVKFGEDYISLANLPDVPLKPVVNAIKLYLKDKINFVPPAFFETWSVKTIVTTIIDTFGHSGIRVYQLPAYETALENGAWFDLFIGIAQKLSPVLERTAENAKAQTWKKEAWNKQECHARLKSEPEGTFVIRESSRKNCLALSVTRGNGKVYDILIPVKRTNYGFCEEYTFLDDSENRRDYKFKTIGSLIKHFHSNNILLNKNKNIVVRLQSGPGGAGLTPSIKKQTSALSYKDRPRITFSLQSKDKDNVAKIKKVLEEKYNAEVFWGWDVPSDAASWRQTWFEKAHDAHKVVCFLSQHYSTVPCVQEFCAAEEVTENRLIVFLQPTEVIKKTNHRAEVIMPVAAGAQGILAFKLSPEETASKIIEDINEAKT
eukprot:m.122015 g.122015  ORF g.122015 m.122015 type:complete len:1696 (+) comp14414_c0_seq8:1305-6392(+)